MKLLIAYASKYGCTEKAVRKLAEYAGEATLVNLKENKIAANELKEYDAVAIGGSIYAGNIQKDIKEFCAGHRNILLTKRIGLFICCGMVDKVEEQLNSSFDKEILESTLVKSHFGYEFNFERMNFLSRLIVKKLAKVKESKFEIEDKNIKEFAVKILQGEVS